MLSRSNALELRFGLIRHGIRPVADRAAEQQESNGRRETQRLAGREKL
jgi:hypothetical protein